MKHRWMLVPIAVVLANSVAIAQAGHVASDTSLPPRLVWLYAKLTHPLNAKKAKPGDRVTAELTADVTVGTVVIPRKSKLIGHVTQVQKRSKKTPVYRLGFVFDQIQLGHGQSARLTGELQSIAPYVPPTIGWGSGPQGRCLSYDEVSRVCLNFEATDSPAPTNDFARFSIVNDSGAGPVIESRNKNIKLGWYTQLTVRATTAP